jgi:hypothetical protein
MRTGTAPIIVGRPLELTVDSARQAPPLVEAQLRDDGARFGLAEFFGQVGT